MKTTLFAMILALGLVSASAAHAAVPSCTGMLDGTPCASGDPCTMGDACLGGACIAGGNQCGDGGMPEQVVPAPLSVVPAACVPTAPDDAGTHPEVKGGVGGCSVDGRPTGGAPLAFVSLLSLAWVLRRKKTSSIRARSGR